MEKYLPYITIIFAISGGIFSFLKYIDLRNREEKRLYLENLYKIIDGICGEQGNSIALAIIANVYKLKLFREKEFISVIVPILDYLKNGNTIKFHSDEDNKYFNKCIEAVLNEFNN